uniref:BTB domain-containing protein n=1 Tax=Mola mola TaxID=94237 RepID=A0A3Q3WI09_MOLML
ITHPHTVLSKLNEQRSQGLFCDVTIVVEDVKFQAHKNILAACSGYFRSALTTPETWSSSQVLELMDLKSEVFAKVGRTGEKGSRRGAACYQQSTVWRQRQTHISWSAGWCLPSSYPSMLPASNVTN